MMLNVFSLYFSHRFGRVLASEFQPPTLATYSNNAPSVAFRLFTSLADAFDRTHS
jgi:hypothetical protein